MLPGSFSRVEALTSYVRERLSGFALRQFGGSSPPSSPRFYTGAAESVPLRPKEEFLCAPLLYEMFEVSSLFYSFEFFEFKDVAEGFCEVRRIQQLSRNP